MRVVASQRTAKPVAPPSGGTGTSTYGPSGYWPTRTPAYGTAATVTVTSNSALRSAISSLAGAGTNTVIAVADGTDLSAGVPQVSAMVGRAENILIRPVNPAGLATDLGDIACDNITLAGFVGTFGLRSGDGAAIARHVIPRTRQVIVGTATGGPTNYQMVEVCAPVRDTASGGDRLHIENGSNGLWVGGWTMGMSRAAGSTAHMDTMQLTGHTGTLTFRNWFFGHASNSATIIAGWEQQQGPQANSTFDTCFWQHSDAGGNDLLWKLLSGGSLTFSHCRSDGTLNLNSPNTAGSTWAPPEPVTCVDTIVAQAKWQSSGGTGHTLTLPGLSVGTVQVPVWQTPSWWSSVREAA